RRLPMCSARWGRTLGSVTCGLRACESRGDGRSLGVTAVSASGSRSERAEAGDAGRQVHLLHQAPPDEIAQRLGGPAAQAAIAHAAEEARDGKLVRETVATVDLHGLARHADAHLVAVDLRHCRERRIGELVAAHRRSIEEAPRRLDLDVHVGGLPPEPLEVTDGMAERLALPQVLDRLLERALGEAEADRCVETALGVEGAQELLHPVALQD